MKKYNWFLVFGVIGLTTLGQSAFTTEAPATKPAPAAKPAGAAPAAPTAKPAAAKPPAAPTAKPAAEGADKPAPAAKPPAPMGAKPATKKDGDEDHATEPPAAKPPTLYVDDASACKGKSRPCSLTPIAWVALKPELQTMAFMHAVQGPKDHAPLPLHDRALFLVYLSEKGQAKSAVGSFLASRAKDRPGFVSYLLAELESTQAALLLLDLRNSIYAGPISEAANARVSVLPAEVNDTMNALTPLFRQDIITDLSELDKPFADDLSNQFPAPTSGHKKKRSGS